MSYLIDGYPPVCLGGHVSLSYEVRPGYVACAIGVRGIDVAAAIEGATILLRRLTLIEWPDLILDPLDVALLLNTVPVVRPPGASACYRFLGELGQPAARDRTPSGQPTPGWSGPPRGRTTLRYAGYVTLSGLRVDSPSASLDAVAWRWYRQDP